MKTKICNVLIHLHLKLTDKRRKNVSVFHFLTINKFRNVCLQHTQNVYH